MKGVLHKNMFVYWDGYEMTTRINHIKVLSPISLQLRTSRAKAFIKNLPMKGNGSLSYSR